MSATSFDSPESIAKSVGSLRGRHLTFSPRYDGFSYSERMFYPIRNRDVFMTKPSGGFWLSVDGGWERWCECEEPDWASHGRYEVEVADDAKVYVISSIDDIDALPQREGPSEVPDLFGFLLPESRIDFERVAEIYDGIFVNISEGGRDVWNAMYGWDCDSVLLFSPDVLVGFRKLG